MSTQESDDSSIYDSDDSEINFLPGYVVEVEKEDNEATVNSSKQLVDDADLDIDTFQPYADEPIASDEWIEEYEKEQESQVQFEYKLQNRFDGNENIDTWCKCGNCKTDCLQNPNEFQCCVEVEECVQCLSSDLVKEELTTTPECITLHPGFEQVCLHKWSLRLAADKYKTKNKTRYRQTGTEERFLRGIAYREFTRLVHGYLGGHRIPLPACAYHKIRQQFPDVAYIGFEVEENDES